MKREMNDLLRELFEEGKGKNIVMDLDSEKGEKLLEMLHEVLKGSEPLECNCFKCETVRKLEANILEEFKSKSPKYEFMKKKLLSDNEFLKAAKLLSKSALGMIAKNIKREMEAYATTRIIIEIIKEQEDTKDESSTRDNQ